MASIPANNIAMAAGKCRGKTEKMDLDGKRPEIHNKSCKEET